ncbi:MAG: tryptophan--tRNA ligase [Clostridia bacterium]|nr:tryptophan--tRNA ligase [Clostridia bacterium]
MNDKKTVFSGIQPSGKITLGNYLGAVKNWVDFQEDCRCIFCVVDEHAITVRQEPAKLRAQTFELLAQLIACGIDPEKYEDTVLYIQSHVPQHAQLSWLLNCYTMFGELSRMTQFKDKSSKYSDNINAGLFTYPVLMAADILLYKTDIVPVGIDQKQHLELARTIAQRFNGVYGDTFTVPEPFIPKAGAKIMSLSEPTKKMSKSDSNENGYILLADTPDVINRKIKRAVTDSEALVCRRDDKPGVNNLMTIYSIAAGKTDEEIVKEFEGKGYGDFKAAVAEALIEMLRPIQEKKDYLLQNKDHLEKIYTESAKKAEWLASRTLEKVYRKVGFVAKGK